MPKQKSWFPAASMQNMFAEISTSLSSLQFYCLWWLDGLGHAAIKYAKLFDFQRVVSMVPQYWIANLKILSIRAMACSFSRAQMPICEFSDDVSNEREVYCGR